MLKISVLLSGFILSTTLNATVVNMGNLTRDTLTGLDWLDLTITSGNSVSDIESGAGGWLASGYRYANDSEIRGLFNNAGIPMVLPDRSTGLDSESYSSVYNLAEMLGLNGQGLGTLNLTGFSGNRTQQNYNISKIILFTSSNFWTVGIGMEAFGHTFQSNGVGHFLVRNSFSAINPNPLDPNPIAPIGPLPAPLPPGSEVPIPTAAWLFGSALIGLGGMKRKK